MRPPPWAMPSPLLSVFLATRFSLAKVPLKTAGIGLIVGMATFSV